MVAREVQGGRLKIYCVRTRGFEPHTMQIYWQIMDETHQIRIWCGCPLAGAEDNIGFDSQLATNTRLAQSVERRTFNPVVVGSSPTLGV